MASKINPWKIQGYKPGQNVIAKIAKPEPGGYTVIIVKDNLPGYLPSNARHNVGDDVLATFVCIDKNRMLLSERFTHGKGDLVKKNYGVNWAEQLDDPNYTTAAQEAVPDPNELYNTGQQYGQQDQQQQPQYADPQQQYGQQQPQQQQQQPQQQYGAPNNQDQQQQYGNQDQYATQQQHAQQQPQQQPGQPDLNDWGTVPNSADGKQGNYGQLGAQHYSQQGQQQDQYQSGNNPAQQQSQQFATGPLPAQYAPSNNQQYMTGPLPAQQPQMEYLNPTPPQQQQQQHHQDSSQYLTGAQPAQRYADGVPTRRFQLRRAIDLIMPPIDADSLRTMRIGDYDVEWLITQLEGGMQTGCVKAACESRLSRAAMLLYRGRAVGCIYGCKSDPTTKPTEESLQAMLSDLESPDTVVTIYDLPEEITLAMSSLFLGYPVERHDDYSAKEYLDYICNWLGQKNGTATLAISLTEDRGTCLGYIYKGEFSGAFYVEDQAYRADRAFVDEMLGNDPRAALEVSILPPEMHASAVRFGFSLSMARTRKLD
ncbi:MAG: hypothetical protein SGJ27_00135 [Candidatus Melainabacteria bacterium]|nr:hypothetical protein [Candidatus Melainabacteria bacterium]